MAKQYGEESFYTGFNPHKTFPQDATSDCTDHWTLAETKILRPMPIDEELRAARVRGHFQPDYRDVLSTRKGVPQIFGIDTFDPNAELMAMLLLNFFQKYTQADGGDPPPYWVTFTIPTDQIDFIGDAGYLIHIAGKHPTALKGFVASDCICTELTITISPDGEKQRLNVSTNQLARLINKNATPYLWGTPDYEIQNFFAYHDLARTYSYVKIDTVAMPFHSCELHMTNNAQATGARDSSGMLQNFKIGPFNGDGTLTLYRETVSDAVIDDWYNGDKILLDILWQTGATFGVSAGDLQLKHYLQIKQPKPDFGPAGEEVWTIPFSMCKGASNDMAWVKVSTQGSMTEYWP